MKCVALSALSLKRIPWLATMPTGWPWMCAKPHTTRRPVLALELVEATAVDDPRDDLARVVRRPGAGRHGAVERRRIDRRLLDGGPLPRRRRPCARSVVTIDRTMRRASSSSAARWSTTPEVRAWTSPPPSSSAVTISPVAALTRGGPPRKIVPCSRTMIVSSHIAGTYAPPAVHEPMTAAICGIPSADSWAWLKKIRPKWSRSGKTSSWSGRNAPPESTR